MARGPSRYPRLAPRPGMESSHRARCALTPTQERRARNHGGASPEHRRRQRAIRQRSSAVQQLKGSISTAATWDDTDTILTDHSSLETSLQSLQIGGVPTASRTSPRGGFSLLCVSVFGARQRRQCHYDHASNSHAKRPLLK